MSVSEDGRRRCRTCGESYEYPAYRSLATRAHCEQCVQIAPQTRRVLEIARRRIDRLTRAIEKLTGAKRG